MVVLNQAAWCALAGLALQFLYIGYRIHYDRSHASFGLSLLLLLAATFPSAWITGAPGPDTASLAWTRSAALAGLAALPALTAFLSHAFHPVPSAAYRTLVGLAAAAGLAMAWELASGRGMFLRRLPGEGIATSWHLAVSGLCQGAFLAVAGRSLVAWRRKSWDAERRRAGWVLAGALAMALGFLADLLAAGSPGFPSGPFSLPCLTLFAGTLVYALLSRCLEIERENLATMDRLASAYAVLRENAGYRELGVSAAMISHEIRNYVATLKGNVLLMGMGRREERGGEPEPRVAALREAADSLEGITRDIAAFTSLTGRAPAGLRQVQMEALIHSCIARHFPGESGRFRVAAGSGPWEVKGDPDGLDQVFLNLFRNAWEAGAQRVEVRFRPWGNRLVVAVEDDGEGCSAEDLSRIGTPFFSGKLERGGTGLGCAVAASILASHGATLRAYAKNAMGPGCRGLVMNAVFPLAGGPRTPSGEPGEFVVAAEAAGVRDSVLPPLLNLGLKPILLSGVAVEARLRESFRRPVLVMEEAWAPRILPGWRQGPAYIADERRVMWRAAADSNPRRFLLCEEGLAELLQGEAAA